MPSDIGAGIVFAVLFIFGVLALLLFLASLEAPSPRRQQASKWLNSLVSRGYSRAVNGRHRGPAQRWSMRRFWSMSDATARRAPSAAHSSDAA
jgi:hypothetical protein